ncbi:uncharacterized protein LOC111270619 isoform X2 [Varroa jacobsoni]|uniref:Uncharacterized protein n=1 Tax=Varroa destructor TaxID=109461 RepID=A0A7M7KIR7_VARDE|nr:uncharacterized protein LOC111252552 isoform X2 [Varroa destructor]XP_022706671.1 uncharacterized protein LOC111270619 isoform X2 [Varroa jacobsoni]
MYLIGLAVQMYEAEDLKARLATTGRGGGESARRKRTVRPSPYEAPGCQESLQGLATTAGGRSTSLSQRVTTQADDTVSSSSDACLSIRDTSRCRLPIRPASTATMVRNAKVLSVRKQPLTLVELLTAGVERPPHGPPRITAQHQNGQRVHLYQQRPVISDIFPQQTSNVHQPRQHQIYHPVGQFSHQQQHESAPSVLTNRLATSGERSHERDILDHSSTGDRSYPQQQQQHSHSAISPYCGNKSAVDESEAGSRSCILQLLRCPPASNSVGEDMKQRAWSPSVSSNHMAFLEAVSVEGVKRCQTGASPTSSTIASSASSSSIASTALTSTTSSEPLVVEADSSNLPLDADLLNEIETGMSSDVLHFTTQPVMNVGIEEQQFQQNLTPACSVTQ